MIESLVGLLLSLVFLFAGIYTLASGIHDLVKASRREPTRTLEFFFACVWLVCGAYLIYASWMIGGAGE